MYGFMTLAPLHNSYHGAANKRDLRKCCQKMQCATKILIWRVFSFALFFRRHITVIAWLCFLILIFIKPLIIQPVFIINDAGERDFVRGMFRRLFWTFWCKQDSCGITVQHFTIISACLPDFELWCSLYWDNCYFQDSDYNSVLTQCDKNFIRALR